MQAHKAAITQSNPPWDAAATSGLSWRNTVLAGLAGVVLLVLTMGVLSALAAREGLGLRASGEQLQAAAAQGDYRTAAAALQRAGSQAARLDGMLSCPLLAWTGRLPVVGPTVAAGRDLVSATDSVLAAAVPLGQSLDAVAAGDPVLAAASLQSRQAELQQLSDAASSAAGRVAAIDAGAVLAPLREPFAAGRAQLADAFDQVAQGAAIAGTLPGMLGVGEPARWLVVLAQPAEARGSGSGFSGAYLSLTASNGRFELQESSSNDSQMTLARDLSWLPAEYQRLWGADAQYLWGFNQSRHYPYAAAAARRALDPAADYVVSLNPRTVAGLLELSGPVVVDGTTIDAGNAEMFFTRDIYLRYPDPAEKDRATLQALQAVFGRLGSVDAAATGQWLAALSGPVRSADVQVWAADPAAARVLEGSGLGGAVPAEPRPWVTVAYNNAGGNKIDSYVATSVDYSVSGDCAAGPVTGTLATQLSIDAVPPGLPPYISGRSDVRDAPYGTTAMLVHLYGPVGAQGLGSVLVDGAAVPAVVGTERGHPVWGVKVELAPGAPVTVEVRFSQPPYPGQPLQVAAQPMVNDTVVSVADRRSCGG